MSKTANTQPIELVTVPEAARRLKACSMTLRRNVRKSGIVPDAVIIAGHNRVCSPLFVTTRLAQLKGLLRSCPEIIA